eukprot:364590-Chlamydomonas_euryale.AAC.13
MCVHARDPGRSRASPTLEATTHSHRCTSDAACAQRAAMYHAGPAQAMPPYMQQQPQMQQHNMDRVGEVMGAKPGISTGERRVRWHGGHMCLCVWAAMRDVWAYAQTRMRAMHCTCVRTRAVW